MTPYQPLDDTSRRDDGQSSGDRDAITIEVPNENQFILLCVLTLGLYAVWWMYKTWRFFDEREPANLYPILRAVLALFFLYSLLQRIKVYALEREQAVLFQPLVQYLAYILLSLTGYLPEPYFLVALASYLMLLPGYRTLYAAMDAEPHFRIHYQERLSQQQLALVFVGGFFWLMMIIGLFGS